MNKNKEKLKNDDDDDDDDDDDGVSSDTVSSWAFSAPDSTAILPPSH